MIDPVQGRIASLVSLLISIPFGIFMYFLPWLIALARRKANKRAIFVLNLLLGWTVVGWVVALTWAFTVEANSIERAS